jgi:hypothetical protein
MTSIIGVKLEARQESAALLQKIATDFGCSIKTRIGLHSVENGVCAPSGVILFDVINEVDEFERALKAIPNAIVQKMVF